MGALHEGHLSLMQLARKQCEIVVVSVFVNPTQFNEAEDFAKYPRDEERDIAMAREAGVDVMFIPRGDEMYGEGFSAWVEVGSVAERLEGAARPRHFRGVATVVAKLFNIVKPHKAYFGQKDAQQVAVVRQMVRDLDFDIGIVVGKTVREESGLAMSSRNARLTGRDRKRAASISAALGAMREAVEDGETNARTLEKVAYWKLDVDRVEYFEVVDGATFEKLSTVRRGSLAVFAGWVGGVRLIDNVILKA
jgi:pantoate--beta-alanine ligase